MIDCKLRDKRRADNPASPMVCVFLMFDRLEDVISMKDWRRGRGGLGGKEGEGECGWSRS